MRIIAADMTKSLAIKNLSPVQTYKICLFFKVFTSIDVENMHLYIVLFVRLTFDISLKYIFLVGSLIKNLKGLTNTKACLRLSPAQAFCCATYRQGFYHFHGRFKISLVQSWEMTAGHPR